MGKKYEFDSVIRPQVELQENGDTVISPEEMQRENELENMRHLTKSYLFSASVSSLQLQFFS